MLRKLSRKILKQALWWARVKLIYSRITLTKFTTLYFFSALLTCAALTVLQAVTYFDNQAASDLIQGLRKRGNSPTIGIVVEVSGHLEQCLDLPSEPGANCTIIGHRAAVHQDTEDDEEFERRRALFDSVSPNIRRQTDLDGFSEADASGSVKDNRSTLMSEDCLQSLHWLSDNIRDARREDLLTLAFVVWLFSISVVAILNESIPHLGAAMAAHVLSTSWASFRVASLKTQEAMYKHLIVNGACGVDVLGNWWTTRQYHTYIVIAFNIVALLLSLYLTFRLYKVYSAHSFRLAGESPVLHTAYKQVLFLSVLLQLSGFFLLGSTALWIDKISTGNIRSLTSHFSIYLGVFVTIAVVDVPWLVLGWISVRRESRLLFFLFAVISLVLLVAPTFLFSRRMFRFILGTWSFFAVITITAYILTVATPIAAILCRLQFGKGLPEYLKETEELEGQDFTPVYFTTRSKRGSETSFESDSEKGYGIKKLGDLSQFQITNLPFGQTQLQAPQSAYTAPKPGRRRVLSKPRMTMSVYSDMARETVKISTTPPVAQGPSPLSSSELASVMQNAVPRHVSPASKSPGRGLPSNPRPSPAVTRSDHAAISNPTFMGGYF